MKKKCKECGDMYETDDQSITIEVNHKDIEALEDALFCELSETDHNKIEKRINKIWKQICEGEEKWGK
jgi:transcription initiation factor IIE alpha subunit